MLTQGLSHWADIFVVVLYFVLVTGVAIWSMCRSNRGNVKSYFLAGSSLVWLPVGASLYSSNIGAEHFVGLAGTGAASGIAIILYEWLPALLVFSLGWFFLPVYISSGVFTLPEYMGKRFGGKRIRLYLSIFSLLMYIVTKLAVSIFSGSLYIQLALGWNMYLSITCLLVLAGIYTILGGLTAVVFTDTFQTGVMTIGGFIVMGFSYYAVGGYENIQRKYFETTPTERNTNSTCGLPREDAFHIFRDPVKGDLPWPGFVLTATFGCVWYWCCDQVIVQRTLAAKNLSHAKGGTLVAGLLKILPLFTMVLPGMISRVLYPDEVACSDPEVCMEVCDNPLGCSNIAYPKLVLELLPVGARGLLMAVMVSAIMSSLTSIFNSASTIFTMDLWRRFRPRAGQRELLIVGRAFVVLMCIIAILWVPLVKSSQGGQVFLYLTATEGFLGAPIGAVFIWSLLWKRMTERAAFWGMIISSGSGLIRLILELVYQTPHCDEPDTRPSILKDVHYMYFCPLVMVIASIVIVTISLIDKQDTTDLTNTTWWTRIKVSSRDEVATSDEVENGKEMETMTIQTHDLTVEVSRLRRWLDKICGIPEDVEVTSSAEISIQQRRSFLREIPKTRYVLNTAAVFSIALITFLCGFYH
ncbi:hypothetical protein ACJMK2_018240 [Sinanodonta woodiana]|uniref:Sodium/glucose cotransporter 4 n=1 Tax=Sinanodonta woodiana TaxID=1069815 RepID=A0ABD3UD47_SINWO